MLPVWVTPEVLPATLTEIVRHVGEPLADPAWLPTALLARSASEEVRLALIGEGADELFGGYPTYVGARISGGYARLPPHCDRFSPAPCGAGPPATGK